MKLAAGGQDTLQTVVIRTRNMRPMKLTGGGQDTLQTVRVYGL